MSWKKTSIVVNVANDKYPKGKKKRNFNNIVENPTKEQMDLFVEGLLLLSDGDTHINTEVIKHDVQGAE